MPEVAWQLIEYAEKPITIVYDSPSAAAGLAAELQASDGKHRAMRLTREEFSAALCRGLWPAAGVDICQCEREPTPMCFAQISSDIIDGADYVCESRRDEAPATAASTVMWLSAGGPV